MVPLLHNKILILCYELDEFARTIYDVSLYFVFSDCWYLTNKKTQPIRLKSRAAIKTDMVPNTANLPIHSSHCSLEPARCSSTVTSESENRNNKGRLLNYLIMWMIRNTFSDNMCIISKGFNKIQFFDKYALTSMHILI